MKKFSLQSCGSVEFATDIENGRITYASFGGENRQSVTIAEDSEFGQACRLLVLWIAGIVFKSRNYVNDFIMEMKPIIRKRFVECQGWASGDDITDVVVNAWQKMTGNSPKGGKPFDPSRSMLSTYLGYQVSAFMQEKNRETEKSKRLRSMSAVVDSDVELSSIGPKTLFGLTFEPSDPDVAPSKWTKMSAKKEDPTFERIARKEESAGLRKLLRKLPSRNAEALYLYFVGNPLVQEAVRKPLTLQDTADIIGISKMGVLKILVRTINVCRKHYGIEGAIISLGGKNRVVKSIDIDNADEVVIRTELSREWVALRDLAIVRKFAKKSDAKKFAKDSKKVVDIVSMIKLG